MKSKFVNYVLPILLFSVIWGAVEFLVAGVRFSETKVVTGANNREGITDMKLFSDVKVVWQALKI